ncbi:uncharacterized protein BO97DRAFT_463290 [Aspergillus homomorphus CBS 101889]|uniref:Uncharacterized protein n=1 Tax=Aspergillus homomorphus (strain CBS 101889) TaxID=1450537 RepID=A0A395I503_ASPHC|nr:hypothetical protein BO97DRAFT_463290 [Aspergillus homomorphus CBS 101889]RAL15292.1 hypothetical protein BO97DRAFT_463290 [Aspergillus homomorphus CBS 101889]
MYCRGPGRGVSDETPLKLWSTKASLKDYLESGPSMCLKDRLQRTSGIPAGLLDDSSISSFDSRPTSAHVRSSIESAVNPTAARLAERTRSEPIMSRPSLRESRSFMAPASPRIHVTEPLGEGYFDVPQETAPDMHDPIEQAQHDTEAEIPTKDDGVPIFKHSQTSASTRYKTFLPVPKLTRDKQDEERAEKPRRIPRFGRPEPGSEKLLWIHVPYTHTGWVPPILARACREQDKKTFFEKLMDEENWYSNLIRARHLEPHARYVRPACIHFKQEPHTPLSAQEEEHDPRLALYVPYLHWDTYSNLVHRRKMVEERLRQGRFRPVPHNISTASLESKLIWKLLGNEPPIHIRRTLDQFGYPNLRSTVARDDDQMLWKRTKKKVNPSEFNSALLVESNSENQGPFMDGKVLMVDQLWLWIVDEKTVVTFFPHQEATTAEGKLYEQSNLYNSIYNELNGDLARRFETAGDLAALIVLHAATVLLDRTLHRDLQILRIFEESISILTESMTKSFKRFRNRGFITRPADFNKNADGKPMSATEREERDHEVANRNREDLSTLLELRDIIDELGTILKLLDVQATTIKMMSTYFEHKGCGKVFMETALSRLEEYRNQVLEMRENASLAQKAVENLLDLKQKQANVDESRLARWEAEVTQDQSRSVMVFTIFTIIFLPLSFFTSLFGINAREWSGEPENLTLGQMLYISGPTSFAIIIIALLIAFNERLRETLWRAQKLVLNLLADFLFAPVTLARLQWHNRTKPMDVSASLSTLGSSAESSSLGAGGGRRRRFRRNHNTQRQYTGEDDFWLRHEDKMITALSVAVPGNGVEGDGFVGGGEAEKGGADRARPSWRRTGAFDSS